MQVIVEAVRTPMMSIGFTESDDGGEQCFRLNGVCRGLDSEVLAGSSMFTIF